MGLSGTGGRSPGPSTEHSHRRADRGQWRILSLIVICVLLVQSCRDPVPGPTATADARSGSDTSFAVTPTVQPASTATPLPLPESLPLPLTLTSYFPQPGEEIPANAQLSWTFDQPVDPHTVRDAISIVPALDGTWQPAGERTVVFKPTSLAPGVRYAVSLGQAATAASGQRLTEGLDYTFSVLAPLQVTRTTPAPGSTDHRSDRPVVVEFNYGMVAPACVGRGNAAPDACPELPLSFVPVVMGTGYWAGTSRYVFEPLTGLAAGEIYEVTLAGDVSSVSGASPASAYVWSFQTAVPRVEQVTPGPGAADAPVETDIRVGFSTPMDTEGTAHELVVTGESGEIIPGTIKWLDGDAELVFRPLDVLALDTTYQVTLGPRARAKGSAQLATEGYAWAFSTLPPPALATHTPQDGATGTSIYAPTRLSFTGAVDEAELRAGVQVTSTAGSHDVFGSYDAETGVYSIAWERLPRTVYCVVVSPDVGDVYGNTLGEPARFCFETGDLPASAELGTAHGAVTLDADRPSALRLWVRNADQLAFTLSASEIAAFLRGDPGTEVRFWRESVTAVPNQVVPADIALQSQGGPLPTGLYHLRWEVPGGQGPAYDVPVAVVDHHVMIKLGDTGAMVWVTDLASGAPISRTEVQILDQEGLLIAGGTTDLDGLVSLPVPSGEEGALWRTLAAVTGQPGEPGFGIALTSWQGEASPWRFGVSADLAPRVAYQAFLATDRSTYRPGERAEIAALVREASGDVYRLPQTGVTTTLTLRDGNGAVVERITGLAAESGWISAALSLPLDLPPGAYEFSLSLPSSDSGAWVVAGSTAIEVAPYRLPDYQVRVVPGATAVINGQANTVAVEATYHVGGGVVGAQVAWRVYAEPYAFHPGTTAPNGADPWVWQASRSRSGRALVADGTGTIDRRGNLMLRLPTEIVRLNDADPGGSQRWVVDVVVTDGDGCTVSGTGAFVVHASDVYLGLRPASWVTRPKERLALDIRAADRDGLSLPGQAVDLSLMRRTWYRAGPSATWAYTDTQISEQRVEMGADGTSSAAFTAPRSGLYVVTAETVGGAELPAANEISFWVGGDEGNGWPADGSLLTLVSDAVSYQVGDVAKILVPVDAERRPYQVLLTVERDGVIAVERHSLAASNPILEVPILDTYVPNVYVSVVVIRPATETSPATGSVGYIELPVDPAERLLTVAVGAQKGSHEPGDEVLLTIRTTDHAGRPVPADLVVAVTDQGGADTAAPTGRSLSAALYGSCSLRVATGDGLLVSGDLGRMEAPAAGTDMWLTGGPAAQNRAASGATVAAMQVVQRSWAETAYWTVALRSNASGEATAVFTLPDALATWQVRVLAATEETRVGEGQTTVVATQPLYIRPIVPPAFVDGDRTEVAALVHNTTADDLTTEVTLDAASGLVLETPAQKQVAIGAGEVRRVVWPVLVSRTATDEVVVTLTAQSGAYRDTARPFHDAAGGGGMPIVDASAAETVVFSGYVTPETPSYEVVEVPATAVAGSTLRLQLEPSYVDLLAVALDAQSLCADGVDACAGDVMSAGAGYGALRQRTGNLGTRRRALEAALTRLVALQNPDGGWGWWRDRSNMRLTSYAVLALQQAESAGVSLPQGALEPALTYVSDAIAQGIASDLHQPSFALGLRVLAAAGWPWPQGAGSALYADRQALGVEGRAHLAVAYGLMDPSDTRTATLLNEIRSAAATHDSAVHWEAIDPEQWTTSVQLTAAIVDALAVLDPDAPEIASALGWLLQARDGMDWRTAYERAWVLTAVADTVALQGDSGDALGEIRVAINGRPVPLEGLPTDVGGTLLYAEVDLDSGDGVGVLRRGPNLIEVISGEGAGRALPYTGQLSLALSPDSETAAESRGLEISRRYCLPPSADAVPVGDGASPCEPVDGFAVGDLVDVHLTLTVPETRFYVELKDPLPAGFAAVPNDAKMVSDDRALPAGGYGGLGPDSVTVATQPGSPFGAVDVDERAVTFLAERLPPGSYEVVYSIRAVIPGRYRALPAVVRERFFPEVYGRTAPDHLQIGARLAD